MEQRPSASRFDSAFAVSAAGALLGVAACGGAQRDTSFEEAEQFFTVGVDPHGELDAIRNVLAGLGFEEVRRVETSAFCAAAYDAPVARTAVRITTPRGLALALDADATQVLGLRVALDPDTGRDLDADGRPDAVVERRRGRTRCVALLRFDADGTMLPVSTESRGLDASACIASLRDEDGNGTVEALVPESSDLLGDTDATEPPSIVVPLTLRDGRFARSPWPPRFLASETGQREAAFELARDAGRTLDALRIAVELAWIARESQSRDAVATFEAHVARLALAAELAPTLSRVRGWLTSEVVPFPVDEPAGDPESADGSSARAIANE